MQNLTLCCSMYWKSLHRHVKSAYYFCSYFFFNTQLCLIIVTLTGCLRYCMVTQSNVHFLIQTHLSLPECKVRKSSVNVFICLLVLSKKVVQWWEHFASDSSFANSHLFLEMKERELSPLWYLLIAHRTLPVREDASTVLSNYILPNLWNSLSLVFDWWIANIDFLF